MYKNQQESKQIDQNYSYMVIKLENLYSQNKDKWINEIVERCLK